MTKHRVGRVWVLHALGIGIVLLLLALPHLASAYHLEVGGWADHDPDAAKEHLLKAIEWDSKNAQAHRLLGKLYLAGGDPSSASQSFQRYTELRPSSPLGYMELAEAYEVLRDEEGTDALPNLDARIAATWQKTGMTIDGMIDQGVIADDEGRYDDALAWYERAVSLDPESGDSWYYIGLLHEHQAQWAQALEAYERALTYDRYRKFGRSSFYYRIGLVYQQRLDPPQLDTALEAYEAAFAAGDSPSAASEAWLHARVGQIAYKLNGDAVTAEEKLLTALDLSPGEHWLHVLLGDFYQQEGRKNEAIAAYQEALDLVPGWDTAQKRLQALGQGE